MYTATMGRVAIMAEYLCEKNDVDDLYVCDNLAAMRAKVTEFVQRQVGGKLALIVPGTRQQAFLIQVRTAPTTNLRS